MPNCVFIISESSLTPKLSYQRSPLESKKALNPLKNNIYPTVVFAERAAALNICR